MKNSLIHRADMAPVAGGHDTEQPAAKQAIKRRCQTLPARAGAVALVLFCAAAFASFATPSAQQILAAAREQVARQNVELQGQLRENEMVLPFRLTQTGPVIRYAFTNPPLALQIRLGESEARLEEITGEGIDKITGAEFDQKVRGTAISYEDLALRFIYWPNACVVGEDTIKTRRVWKLELQPPGRQSQYSRVFLWCEQESGALMRMEGYNWSGKLAKRFEVQSVQKIEGRYFLKQMRIEQLQPETGKVQVRTYLEIKR